MRIKPPQSNFNQRKNRSTFGHSACMEAVHVMQTAEQYGSDRAKRMTSDD